MSFSTQVMNSMCVTGRLGCGAAAAFPLPFRRAAASPSPSSTSEKAPYTRWGHENTNLALRSLCSCIYSPVPAKLDSTKTPFHQKCRPPPGGLGRWGGGDGVLLLGVCLTHIYSAEPPCVLDEPLKAAPTGSDQIYAPDRTFFCVRFDLVNLPLLEFVPSADRFGDNSTRV